MGEEHPGVSEQSGLRHDVETLCAPEMAGRAPGTPGGALSAAYVEERMREVGLEPGGEDGYRQAIPPIGGSSVLGVLRGTGDGWVLLAAHHDHLGDWGGGTCWGANDNAAAVAVMLQAAGFLAGRSRRLRRSVLFCAFDAEEPPYFMGPYMGSQWFVDHPTIPLRDVDLMIALDLVGTRLGPPGLPPEVGESIFMQGAETSTGTRDLVDGVPVVRGIRPRHITDWVIASMSDQHAFREAGIPWLFYTVGRDARYHTPADTPETLDYPKMAALAEHLGLLISAAADAEGRREYIADPAGDGAMLESLTELLGHLAELVPDAAATLEVVEGLAGRVQEGRLDDEERAIVGGIIRGLEQGLGGNP